MVHMTAKEFNDALAELGWTKTKLKEKIGVHKNSITGWSHGRVLVPGPVTAYLRLALAVRRLGVRLD